MSVSVSSSQLHPHPSSFFLHPSLPPTQHSPLYPFGSPSLPYHSPPTSYLPWPSQPLPSPFFDQRLPHSSPPSSSLPWPHPPLPPPLPPPHAPYLPPPAYRNAVVGASTSSFTQSIPLVHPRPLLPSPPSTTTPPSAVSHLSPASTAPLVRSTSNLLSKLSVRLMSTYNGINDAYYAKRAEEREQRRRDREQREREKALRLQKEREKEKAAKSEVSVSSAHSSTSSTPTLLPLPTPTSDDRDSNYVVRQHEVLHNRYTVEHSLGKGSFGRVIQCYDSIAQRSVAIKIVKSKRAFYKQAQVEIRILQSLQPEADKYNIVQLLDTFMHAGHQCIVFELLSINLYDLIRNTKFNGVTLILCAKFAYQLLHTLAHLTSPSRGNLKVIHCDIKPENILLRSKQRSSIKLIDFGSSCLVSEKAYTYIQSRFYRAPEVLLGASYGSAIDMWSLGCLLMELHTGHPLFDGADEKEQILRHHEVLGPPPYDLIEGNAKALTYFDLDPFTRSSRLKERFDTRKVSSLQAELGSKWKDVEEYRLFLDLVGQLLVYDPRARIKPYEAINHPFFDLLQSGKGGGGASVSASPEGTPSPPPGPSGTTAVYPTMAGEGRMTDVQPVMTRDALQTSIPIFSSSSSSSDLPVSTTTSAASSSTRNAFNAPSALSNANRQSTWSAVVSASVPRAHAPVLMSDSDRRMSDADKPHGNVALIGSSASLPPPLSRGQSSIHTRPNVYPPLPPSHDEYGHSSSPTLPSHPTPILLPPSAPRRRRPPSDSRTARTALVMSLRSRTRPPIPATAPSSINTSNRFAALESSSSPHASQEDGSADSMNEHEEVLASVDSVESPISPHDSLSPPESSLFLRSRPVLRRNDLQRKGGGDDLHVLMTDDASDSPTSGGLALCVERRGSGSPKGKDGRRRAEAGKVVRVGSKSAVTSHPSHDEGRQARRKGRSRSVKGGGMQTRSTSHKSSHVDGETGTAMEDTEPLVMQVATQPRFTRSRGLLVGMGGKDGKGVDEGMGSEVGGGGHLRSPRPSHFSNRPPESSRRPITRQSHHHTTQKMEIGGGVGGLGDSQDESISQRTRSHISLR